MFVRAKKRGKRTYLMIVKNERVNGKVKQMVVGVVLDNDGRPICSELWPGNTADVKTLVPIVERLKGKFSIRNICVVADRGMVSQVIFPRIDGHTNKVL